MSFWSFVTGQRYETPEEVGAADAQEVINLWDDMGYPSKESAAKWIAYDTSMTEVASMNANPVHKSYIGGFLKGLLG